MSQSAGNGNPPSRTISYASTACETIATYNGRKVGAVWGPAVEGDWFALRIGEDPVRVPTREEAELHLLPLMTMPLPAEYENPAPGCGCFVETISASRFRRVPCPAHGGQVLAQAASEPKRKPCPEGFHWIGQSGAWCDKCGLPGWDHDGFANPSRSPEHPSGWVLEPWRDDAHRDRFRKHWEPDLIARATQEAEQP